MLGAIAAVGRLLFCTVFQGCSLAEAALSATAAAAITMLLALLFMRRRREG